MLGTDTVLQNRYTIIRPLGRGGMGAVYEVHDARLSRTVALKETLVETDELRRAFEREARLLANLRHPVLPKVLDHFSEGTGLFLVMEYIPGDDLGVMLEQERHIFASAEVLRWADQLLDALEFLHTLNPPVVHRDIKPSNLKLIPPSQIVLLDFGLAKGTAGQMTHTANKSVLAYSPNYSSLEQIQGAGTDVRSDLYSLGATLYHLITGVKPPDALSRVTAVVNGQPDPLRPAHEVNQEVHLAVSAALMRAMALNMVNRPRTAAEMRDDLRNRRPRAAATVPMADVDETTKVSLRASRASAITQDVARGRERGRQVVVHLPEDTLVAQKQSGRGRTLILAVGLIVGLITLSALLYFSYTGNDASQRTPSDRPAASRIPSLIPTVNTNQQDNVNTQPVVSPAELAAREKLAEKNVPFTEEAFSRVVEDGDVSRVELFLAAGMNPNVKDGSGRADLINAAAKGSDNISRKLLNKGADVNAADTTGLTALMEAVTGDHQETTKVLLENGADVNRQDNNGQTAILRAASHGRREIVRMLINKGAKIDIKDRQGRDALSWAEINNHVDVIELLKKAGASK